MNQSEWNRGYHQDPNVLHVGMEHVRSYYIPFDLANVYNVYYFKSRWYFRFFGFGFVVYRR